VALLTVELLFFIVLLFPDGRLPSRRWRPVLWAMFVVLAGGVAAQLQVGTYISGGFTNALDAARVSYPNPVGFLPRHGWFSGLIAVIFALALICAVLSVASVFVRRRGASTERRKQLAWLGYVGVMTVGWAAVLSLVGPFLPSGTSFIGTVIWSFLVLTPVAGIPLACAVAVLKYRLYEIDRLISRTVAYAIVTGLLVGVYAGLVLLATRVLPLRGSVAVAGSTLVAAAMFTPLRRRVQRVVDRRFNRTRYDAEPMITAFAARLQDATDLDAVRADLTSTVHQALEPAHLSLWFSPVKRSTLLSIQQGGDGRVAAHLVQVAAAGRADAADGDAQLGADVGVRYGRVRDEHGDQLLAVRGQLGERLAQRRMALGRQQLLVGPAGPLVRKAVDVQRIPGRVRYVARAQDAEAFPPGGGGEPAGQRGRLADLVQLVHQAQPDALADVVGVGAAESVPAADRPNERGVPLDEGVPRLLVAVSGAPYQVAH
jgi:hypothetical protein